MKAPLRFIIDPPLPGPVNMAVDDCLLSDAAECPVLRFYRWQEPTLSLGYFQSFDNAERLNGPLADLPVVRRVTGGGAILHADELTYSIALPPDHELAGSAPAELYVWMHRRVTEAVADLGAVTRFKGCDNHVSPRGGPFLCFQRHAGFDLVDAATGLKKFAGSAQRRTRRGVLQHGSVVLSRTHPVQPSAALDEMLGRKAGFEELVTALIKSIRSAGVELDTASVSDITSDAMRESLEHHASYKWLRLR